VYGCPSARDGRADGEDAAVGDSGLESGAGVFAVAGELGDGGTDLAMGGGMGVAFFVVVTAE